MKKLKLRGLLSLIILGIFAPAMVFAGEWNNADTPDSAWTVQEVQTRTLGDLSQVSEEREEAMIPITIQIGEKIFDASLQNNDSAQALLASFPMTVTMDEMNGNEKYEYLPTALPTASRSIGNIHSGDIMLFGSDCLVLFYEDFHTSYRYTQLGAISDPTGLSEALGKGSVQVTFNLRTQ